MKRIKNEGRSRGGALRPDEGDVELEAATSSPLSSLILSIFLISWIIKLEAAAATIEGFWNWWNEEKEWWGKVYYTRLKVGTDRAQKKCRKVQAASRGSIFI